MHLLPQVQALATKNTDQRAFKFASVNFQGNFVLAVKHFLTVTHAGFLRV